MFYHINSNTLKTFVREKKSVLCTYKSATVFNSCLSVREEPSGRGHRDLNQSLARERREQKREVQSLTESAHGDSKFPAHNNTFLTLILAFQLSNLNMRVNIFTVL